MENGIAVAGADPSRTATVAAGATQTGEATGEDTILTDDATATGRM